MYVVTHHSTLYAKVVVPTPPSSLTYPQPHPHTQQGEGNNEIHENGSRERVQDGTHNKPNQSEVRRLHLSSGSFEVSQKCWLLLSPGETNHATRESFYGSPPNFSLTKSPVIVGAPGRISRSTVPLSGTPTSSFDIQRQTRKYIKTCIS